MQFRKVLIMIVLVAGAYFAYADCPYDHVLVGQNNGTLFLDTTQIYRHWNSDWSAISAPYGQQYYEFSEIYGGGYIRVEPGFSENTDTTYSLVGTRGEDYNIIVERVFTTPGLELYDDMMNPILISDGSTFCLSGYANHHVHVRYYLSEGMDPTLPYSVSYRLFDSTGTYADSIIYTFNLGAIPEPAAVAILLIAGITMLKRKNLNMKSANPTGE